MEYFIFVNENVTSCKLVTWFMSYFGLCRQEATNFVTSTKTRTYGEPRLC